MSYLDTIYSESDDSEAKSNMLGLFEHLKEIEPEYIYQILKNFAEKEKKKYLDSNFVEFMNTLSRERRKRLFNEIDWLKLLYSEYFCLR